MTDADALLLAACNARNALLADTVTMILGLAAETHPGELRTALAKVFDTTALEERIERTLRIANEAQRKAAEVHFMAKDLEADLDGIVKQLDTLNLALDAVAKRVANAVKFAQKLKAEP